MAGRKIISLCKLVNDLCPIAILTEEIAVEVTEVVGVSSALWYFRYIASIFLTTQVPVVEVTGVVGVSPALWYFRYIASIFLTLHKRLWFDPIVA